MGRLKRLFQWLFRLTQALIDPLISISAGNNFIFTENNLRTTLKSKLNIKWYYFVRNILKVLHEKLTV